LLPCRTAWHGFLRNRKTHIAEISGKKIVKELYVKGKLVNIVAK
jgi:hypothetical protein